MIVFKSDMVEKSFSSVHIFLKKVIWYVMLWQRYDIDQYSILLLTCYSLASYEVYIVSILEQKSL